MTYQPFPSFDQWEVRFDDSLVERYSARLRTAKSAATEEQQRRALEIATRYAAVDTGALEGLYTTDRGFTRTIATQTEYWQQALAQRDGNVKRLIDDALAAYDFVLDAATGSHPITQTWIRELHATITAHQDSYEVQVLVDGQLVPQKRPLPHGVYKEFPNNPTSRTTGRIHDYAPPADTESEMARLVNELRQEAFTNAHPVVQAAYAHYAYVCVHPFSDGNGRVARAMASVFLYRNPGIPLVIFADQRDRYIDALELADVGRPQSFVDFISERVIDTISMVTQSLASAATSDDSESREVVGEIEQIVSQGPSTELILDSERLSKLAAEKLREKVASLRLPSRVETTVYAGRVSRGRLYVPQGYRVASRDAGVWATSRIVSPPYWLQFEVFVADPVTDAPELLIAGDEEVEPLEVWKREIDPQETATLDIKLDTWAGSVADLFARRIATGLQQVHQE